jgi:hypothetical protein
MQSTPLTQHITDLGLNANEFLIFLQDSLNDARQFQELKNQVLSETEQIKLEVRLTEIEYLVVVLESESA